MRGDGAGCVNEPRTTARQPYPPCPLPAPNQPKPNHQNPRSEYGQTRTTTSARATTGRATRSRRTAATRGSSYIRGSSSSAASRTTRCGTRRSGRWCGRLGLGLDWDWIVYGVADGAFVCCFWRDVLWRLWCCVRMCLLSAHVHVFCLQTALDRFNAAPFQTFKNSSSTFKHSNSNSNFKYPPLRSTTARCTASCACTGRRRCSSGRRRRSRLSRSRST